MEHQMASNPLIQDSLIEWITAKEINIDKRRLLERRIEPVEREMDALQDKLDGLIADGPTWREFVVMPIIQEIKSRLNCVIKEMQDKNRMQFSFMCASKEHKGYGSMITFCQLDKVAGDFEIKVDRYNGKDVTHKVLKNAELLTIDYIVQNLF